MRLRTILIDAPAKIVDIWFRAYLLLALAMTTLAILTAALSLLLWLVGIRWGW